MSSASPPTSFVDSDASVLLDLLRGAAGILVLISHARNYFFVEFPLVTTHRALLAGLYLLTGAGHQAVVVFFVLSGFFISRSIFQAAARGRWSWPDYLLRRVVRLWLVLIPALLLCLGWDLLGMHFYPAATVYRGESLSPVVFAGNLFFLQTVLVHSFGSDGALWSIANEFWYYLLFPLGFLALRPTTRPLERALCAALLVAAAALVHGTILLLFPVWLTGTLLALLAPLKISAEMARRMLKFAFPLYLLCFFGLSRVRNVSDMVADYSLTVATFGLLRIVLAARNRAWPEAVGVRASRVTARFSYSLYALHTPVLVFAAAVLGVDRPWLPSSGRILFTIALCLGILGYAYGFASLTEFHTDKVRQAIERAFGLRAPRAELASDPGHAS